MPPWQQHCLQSHPARLPGAPWQHSSHLLTAVPSVAPLYELGRPDLQWFVGAAYYVLAMVAPCGADLQAEICACTAEPWCVTNVFDAFAAAVAAAGVPMAKCNGKNIDFYDGGAKVSCTPNDKVLVLLVLLFGETTEWLNGAPPGAPKPVVAFIAVVRNWAARRFPTYPF